MKKKHALLIALLCASWQTALAEGACPPDCGRPGASAADARRPPPRGERPPQNGRPAYSLEQATSDGAQLHTIAFSALAFLTGDFGLDTFLPPGKVSDYFGFQYLRDIDVREDGHRTSFLTRIANNILQVLDAGQRAQLLALAREQEGDIRRFAELRYPLMQAFRVNLEGRAAQGKKLSREAVMKYSAGLYELDGQLAYRRAQVMAGILASFNDNQKAALRRLKFGDSATWPEAASPLERRQISHENEVAVMTYASEMFSWAAGSLDSDTYFCPERHGMYFGGFGMKTAPAMGKKDYAISTALTGDSGEAFLNLLNPAQRRQMEQLVDEQHSDLLEIVSVRRSIASELRRFLAGQTASRQQVLQLSRRYGELDGRLSWRYATTFAAIGQSLSGEQKQLLRNLRPAQRDTPKGPFLYSEPVGSVRTEGYEKFFITSN